MVFQGIRRAFKSGLLALALSIPSFSNAQEPVTILRIEEPIKEAVLFESIDKETPENKHILQNAFKSVQNATIPIRYETCFEDVIGDNPSNYPGGTGKGVFLKSKNDLLYATCFHNTGLLDRDAEKFIKEKLANDKVQMRANPKKSSVRLDGILLNDSPKSDASRDIAVYNVTHLRGELTKKYTPLEVSLANSSIFKLGDRVNWLNYFNKDTPFLEFAGLVNLHAPTIRENVLGGIEAGGLIKYGYSGQPVFNVLKSGEVNLKGIITNLNGTGTNNGNCIFIPFSAVQDLIKSYHSGK